MKIFTKPRSALRARGTAVLAATMVTTSALLAQTLVATNATWNDAEWVHSDGLGTLDCVEPAGQFATRAEGRFLSGSLLDINLDSIAEAERVEVTNDGSRSIAPVAGTPVSGMPDAYADPLSAEVLSLLNLNLTGLLELPADASTGVVGQFGQAQSDGTAVGASGLITDSGGIDLSQEQPGDYPDLATLQFSEILGSPLLGDLGLGTLLSNVADLTLELGAVAGRASYSTCDYLWGTDPDTVNREYLAASADLGFSSPLIGAMVSAIGGSEQEQCTDETLSTVKLLECAVNGLASDEGVVDSLVSGVTDLLGTLTNGLGLGEITADLTATVDLSGVQALLDDTLTDTGGVVALNLGDGTVHVDTAALLEAAYPGTYTDGLNGLAPNTNPLADPGVFYELVDRLSTLLSDWVVNVQNAITTAIGQTTITAGVHIDLELDYGLSTYPIGDIEVAVDCRPTGSTTAGPGCTLAELLDSSPNPGVQEVTAGFTILPGLGDIPLVGDILVGLVNGLTDTVIAVLLTNLVGGAAGLVGTVVNDTLDPVVTGAVNALPGLTEPVVNLVSDLYNGLFLSGIVALTINAQNDTSDPNDVEPQEWATLPQG